jgi:putative DNA primase/helicase
MSTPTQFDLGTLLEKAGGRPHGNRFDCPKCGGLRTVSHTDELYYCHKCQWKGNTVSLAKELGLYQRLPPAEYREFQRTRELAHEVERDKETRKHAEARRLAESLWAKARQAPETHPYLTRKRVMPHGLRLSCANLVIAIPDLEGVRRRRQFIPAGSLVIPVRDVGGTLHSLQFITPTGDKQFLYGGRVAGCCYGLGLLNERLYLAEGFATGGTIFEATGEAVAVCFFAGNLQYVAEAVRRKCPRAELIICADNDRKTPGNPGLSAAKAVARRFMGRAVWPTFPPGAGGSDFNDLAREIGTEALRQELQSVSLDI